MNSKSSIFLVMLIVAVVLVCKGAPRNNKLQDGVQQGLGVTSAPGKLDQRDTDEIPLPKLTEVPETPDTTGESVTDVVQDEDDGDEDDDYLGEEYGDDDFEGDYDLEEDEIDSGDDYLEGDETNDNWLPEDDFQYVDDK